MLLDKFIIANITSDIKWHLRFLIKNERGLPSTFLASILFIKPNMHLPKNNKNKSKFYLGQTLIGILVALAIFSILSQSIFTVVVASLNFVSFNRARITARHLAQEKLELIRNLPYEDVGTVGGIPAGPLPQEETSTRNKLNFNIKTTIIYIDDPFDEQAPNDLLATDYKRVRVEVSWEGITKSRNSPVVLLSDISPKGIETTAGGGTLSIIVFDSNGNPVPQADVAIVAPGASPPVNLTIKTADNGRVILPGAPACVSCYQISVSKVGFSSERTYSQIEVANPTKPHQTIIAGQLTSISFSIDKVSTLNLSTKRGREDNFDPLANYSFRLRGEKTIGIDTNNRPVYKYDEILTSDSAGNLTLNNLEWDNYHFILTDASYDISGTNPLQPIIILPDTTNSFQVALTPHTQNNLLLIFTNPASEPIASVSATLTRNGFEETKLTGNSLDPDFGQVFFSSLLNENYDLTATASGFTNYNSIIYVEDNTTETVILNPL